jgi:hypothetical protein
VFSVNIGHFFANNEGAPVCLCARAKGLPRFIETRKRNLDQKVQVPPLQNQIVGLLVTAVKIISRRLLGNRNLVTSFPMIPALVDRSRLFLRAHWRVGNLQLPNA